MSLRILVVDDSTVVRAMVRKALSLSGEAVGAVHEAGHGGEVLEARLAWSGGGEGELRLAVSPALAASLAANLLGVDEAPGREEDALGELANMVAGVLVADVYGAASSPRLGLPRVARKAAAAHLGERAEAALAVAPGEEEGRRIEARVASVDRRRS